jgi:hypothetical protein
VTFKSAKTLTGAIDGTGKTQFSFWVAKSANCGKGDLASVYATFDYDIDGDGKTDHSESYNRWFVEALPLYEEYNEAVGDNGGHGPMTKAFTGGSVTATISNVDGAKQCSVSLLLSAQLSPSAVRVPIAN